MRSKYKTLFQWKQAHPHVNVLAFEANCDKESGFGDWEEVCGFCLASHYFEKEPPEICQFCRAPIRETEVISDLEEITNRKYFMLAAGATDRPELFRPFLVRRPATIESYSPSWARGIKRHHRSRRLRAGPARCCHDHQ
jgi:hypothetical protein